MFELTIDQEQPARVSHLLSVNCGPASGGLDFVPKNLAYTPHGQLILSDEKNHIFAVGRHDGRLEEVAGSMSFCKRQENGCLRSDFSDSLTVSSKARFGSISDLVVGPDGVVYLTDQERHQVKAIQMTGHLPQLTPQDRYEILDAEHQALLVFDRNGRHESTRGLFASLTGYDFLYDQQRLIQVVDKNTNVLELLRDEDDNFRLTGLVMPNGQVHSLKVNKHGELEQWRTPSNFVTAFHYSEGGTGLVTKMFVGGKMQNVFQFDAETGHLAAIRSPVMSTTADRGRSGDSIGVRQQGLVTQAQTRRENVLIQQLYDSEYLLSPLLAGQDTRLGNLTLHRLGWSYFQHEFRYKE